MARGQAPLRGAGYAAKRASTKEVGMALVVGAREELRLRGVVIATVVGLFGLICTRSGYRARPMGPVRTTYTCDLCGMPGKPGKRLLLYDPIQSYLGWRRRSSAAAPTVTQWQSPTTSGTETGKVP